VWEEIRLNELKEVLHGATVSVGEDSWYWKPGSDATFTVKSAYDFVSTTLVINTLSVPWHAKVFQSLWKSPTPSKVCSFIWQMLHDRIPTKHNLVIRHVITAGLDSLCPMCGLETETAEHLFIYCGFATKVWLQIFSWLDIPFNLPHSLFSILNCCFFAGDPRAKKGRLMIGCAVIWMIWKLRNLILFENGRGSTTEVVEGVKVVAWKWWVARTKKPPCLYYEWRTEPGICLL
jgi:hypothetical protein